jgi:hypothetical protein
MSWRAEVGFNADECRGERFMDGLAHAADEAPRHGMVTCAAQQKDIAVLTDLVIDNASAEDLDDLSVSVAHRTPGDRPAEMDLRADRRGARPRDRHLPLSGSVLDRLTDRVRARVRVALRRRSDLLAKPLLALTRQERDGSAYVPELLAARVPLATSPPAAACPAAAPEAAPRPSPPSWSSRGGTPADRSGPRVAPGAAPARDPALFHEPADRSWLGAMAREIIAAEGPVTLERVSDLIARDHGFQRMGRQIAATAALALGGIEPRTRCADGQEVFWPPGATPQQAVPFCGLGAAGRARDWDEVPLPERLGLLRQVAAEGHADLARAMAAAIGYKRLTETFRSEIATLAALAAETTDRRHPLRHSFSAFATRPAIRVAAARAWRPVP